MLRKLICITCVALSLSITSVQAAEYSNPVNILTLRPIVGGDGAYVNVENANFCNTSWFYIDLKSAGGKATYASALSSIVAGKSVVLEIGSSCTGWGTPLASIQIIR